MPIFVHVVLAVYISFLSNIQQCSQFKVAFGCVSIDRAVPSSKTLGGQILKNCNSAAYIQATAMYFRG